MGQRKRKKHDASPDTSRGKGDILEDIVESMHGYPGAKIEKNVFLPAIKEPDRQREIDVLISGHVGGYPVSIAIECKNVSSPIEVKEIGEFSDKLEDVGIPVRQGVFVTSSRFRSGALSRASELGIKTLQYVNVKTDLPGVVSKAIQSIIFTLLTITQIQVTNDQGGPALAGEILFFRDDDGRLKGSVPDLVWKGWLKGELEDSLGNHSFQIELPPDWHQVVRGKTAIVEKIVVDYQITAHVVDFHGELDQHQLVDQQSGQVSRFHLDATFDPPDGQYPVNTYATEDNLESALRKKAMLHISLGRERLPRIRWMSLYWPPSKRAIMELHKHVKTSLESGDDIDFSAIGIEETEGSDMNALWDPIIPDHPFAKDLGLR